MYRLLQLEADVYLPPIQQANRRFIADLVSGEKKVIRVVVIISALEKESTKNDSGATYRWIEIVKYFELSQK